MKHARGDYNRIQDPEGLIPKDEPVFLLRAQDSLSPAIVRNWAHRASIAGVDQRLVNAALKQANLMEQWPKKKTPDAPEGMV